jgi:phosphate transport system permease protein
LVPTSPPRGNRRLQPLREKLIELALLGCGLLSIAVTLLIAAVLLYGSVQFFFYKDVPAERGEPTRERLSAAEVRARAAYFVTGTKWEAGADGAAHYGILPLLAGTLIVTGIAALIALPIGVACAIYLSEFAPPRVRAFAKPALELLAGIPPVVYGFFALTAVTPLLVHYVDASIGNPHNMLSGGIVVGIMILPMVASLSEDALRAVPRSLRDAAIALGANRFATAVKVVLPAALSGVTASFLLALARAVGETMAVTLACGGSTQLTLDPRQGLATMTSFIVRAAGDDVPSDTTYFYSLFAVAGLLFCLTLGMNIVAQAFIRRYRQVYQ